MRRMRTTGTRWPTWPTSFIVPAALRMAGATVVELTQELGQSVHASTPLHVKPYGCEQPAAL
eukprot:4918209-Prymnesium_polylepis.1